MILKMKRNKSTYRSLVRRIQSKNRIPTLDDIYILFDIGIIGSTTVRGYLIDRKKHFYNFLYMYTYTYIIDIQNMRIVYSLDPNIFVCFYFRQWVFSGYSGFPINKTDRYDIIEIL